MAGGRAPASCEALLQRAREGLREAITADARLDLALVQVRTRGAPVRFRKDLRITQG